MGDVTYEVDGWIRFAEEDDWEKGCIEDSQSADSYSNETISAPSLPELLEKLKEIVPESGMEIDPCEGNIGRVDFFCMENSYGNPLTCAEETAWRKGEGKAWYAVYIFYVQKVTRETVDLTEEAGI